MKSKAKQSPPKKPLSQPKSGPRRGATDGLITVGEYARKHGMTPANISRAIRQGRIKVLRHDGHRPFFDEAQADRDWRNRKDEKHSGAIPSLNESKARAEFFKAEKAEVELERIKTRLVDADLVRRQAFGLARKARDRLMNVPDRIAAEIAAESDARRCHAILAREISDVCREISGDLELAETEETGSADEQ